MRLVMNAYVESSRQTTAFDVLKIRIIDINTAIRDCIDLKRQGVDVDQQAFCDLNNERNRFLIDVLQYRRKIGHSRVQVFLVGDPDETIDGYSRNQMVISLGASNISPRSYTVRTNVRALREALPFENVNHLVGAFDGYESEAPDAFFSRKINEINEITHDLQEARVDKNKNRISHLKKRRSKRIEQVLAKRITGKDTIEGEMHMVLKKGDGQVGDVILVQYFSRTEKKGFSIRVPQELTEEMDRLIQKGGGFDFVEDHIFHLQ